MVWEILWDMCHGTDGEAVAVKVRRMKQYDWQSAVNWVYNGSKWDFSPKAGLLFRNVSGVLFF